MGVRVQLPEGAIERTNGPGVTLESDEVRGRSLVRRLAPNTGSPLYPLVDDRVTWPKSGATTAVARPGVYVIERLGLEPARVARFRYLEVGFASATWVSEAQALVTLGAIEALKALSLDDAAIALTMGDLDAARVQWLRWKDGLS